MTFIDPTPKNHFDPDLAMDHQDRQKRRQDSYNNLLEKMAASPSKPHTDHVNTEALDQLLDKVSIFSTPLHDDYRKILQSCKPFRWLRNNSNK
jgi:hypothetical protein